MQTMNQFQMSLSHARPAPGIMALATDDTQNLAAGKGERVSENI